MKMRTLNAQKRCSNDNDMSTHIHTCTHALTRAQTQNPSSKQPRYKMGRLLLSLTSAPAVQMGAFDGLFDVRAGARIGVK